MIAVFITEMVILHKYVYLLLLLFNSEIEDLPLGEDFLAMALVFFDRAMKGVEPSLAIPTTSVMGLLREEQMKMVHEGVEKPKRHLKECWIG